MTAFEVIIEAEKRLTKDGGFEEYKKYLNEHIAVLQNVIDYLGKKYWDLIKAGKPIEYSNGFYAAIESLEMFGKDGGTDAAD